MTELIPDFIILVHVTEYNRVYTIKPFKDRNTTTIKVYQHKKIGSDFWEKATVNWPAIGDTDSHKTNLFSIALWVASQFAIILNNGYDPLTLKTHPEWKNVIWQD